MRVVVVKCLEQGDIDVHDLKARAAEHADTLAALMITYPSTHGVFEEGVKDICALVHDHGGQVYLDGANLNALVGLARPGDMGADVCHMNLHKNVLHPAWRRRPGIGPIGVKAHLQPFLPGHATQGTAHAVAAAPYGSASILPITWMFIRMMGAEGLKRATQAAILNANYIAERLKDHYPVLFQGRNGRVAHECILDTRVLKESAGITVEDVAKRLIDYGFPRAHHVVAGGRHADGGAHRVGTESRDRPVLRRHDRHRRRGGEGGGRAMAEGRQSARQCPAHSGRTDD